LLVRGIEAQPQLRIEAIQLGFVIQAGSPKGLTRAI
jgi:hypothetical protein